MKVVVYTAITDNYDTLKTNQAWGDADWFCFVDDKFNQENIGNWKTLKACSRFKDSLLNSRIHMICPHSYFYEYDYTLWLDGTFVLRMPVEEIIKEYENMIVLYRHKYELGTYDDAKCARENPKNLHEIEKIDRQIKKYKQEGLPEKNGQAYSGFLLRKQCKQMDIFNSMWWTEVTTFCRCDQISLNYTLWKLGIVPAYLNTGSISIRKISKYLSYKHHKRNKEELTKEAIEKGY